MVMFGEYSYAGIGRLQGWLDSPNLFAVVLGMVLVSGIGLSDWLWHCEVRPTVRWVIRGACLLGLLFLGVLLGMTYSRGGWLAFCVGTATYALLRGVRGKLAWAVLGCVLVSFLAVPKGSSRVASISSVQSDPSLRHRLLVWRSSLAMIKDFAVGGTGSQNFTGTFNAWYKSPELRPYYSNTMNSVFTLGLTHGLWVAGLYILGVSLLVGAGVGAGRAAESPPLLALACAGIVFFTGSLFTDLMAYSSMRSPLGIWAALVAAACGWMLVRKRARFQWRWVGLPLAVSVLACAVLLAASPLAAMSLGQRVEYIALPGAKGARGVLVASGSSSALKGVLICWTDEPQIDNALAPRILRPIAARGYAVAWGLPPWDKAERKTCARDLKRWVMENPQFRGLPVFILGMNALARQAIVEEATRAGARGVIGWGSAWEWNDESQSPKAHLSEIQVPLLLLHGRYNQIIPAEHSRSLADACQRAGKPARIEILPESDQRLAHSDEPRFVEATCQFMNDQTTK